MVSLPTRPDVVVVGAGAAGIAASRALRAAGVAHVVIEARHRLGGRAWTDFRGTAHPLDLGCEWLHSADRNVLAGMAPGLGLTLDKSEPPWRRRRPQVGFGEADQDDFDREQRAFYARLEQAADAVRSGAPDRPASDVLDSGARWNGLADAISTYYNGAPLDRVSVLDFDRYLDTEVNWRVEGGYGAMIASLGADLPVRLGCRVTRVDATGRALRVETDAGTIETDTLIVTVPTSVLAAGAIGFDPTLDDHLRAAANLPLGIANKLIFLLKEGADIPPDTRLIGAPGRRDAGSYTLRPKGRPLVERYFGGDHARALERGGLAAFAATAREEIVAALGAAFGRRLTPLVATAWAGDPLSMGSYSHALPGHADDRAVLARPFEDRIVFAGEATSKTFFSTAHGAFEEGTRVGRWAASRRVTPHRTGSVKASMVRHAASRRFPRLSSCIAAFVDHRLRAEHASWGGR